MTTSAAVRSYTNRGDTTRRPPGPQQIADTMRALKVAIELIGNMPAEYVKRADVFQVLDHPSVAGKATLGHKIKGALRRLYAFGRSRAVINADPTNRD